ncbi:unnamed protein product, partial [Ilex paraguariensis]
MFGDGNKDKEVGSSPKERDLPVEVVLEGQLPLITFKAEKEIPGFPKEIPLSKSSICLRGNEDLHGVLLLHLVSKNGE